MNIADPQQAAVLLHPDRVRVLALLQEPATPKELARQTGFSPQRVNNYVRDLERAGLVRVVRTVRRRNFTEHTYQAVARTYWLSPRLVRDQRSEEQAREQRSLHNLLAMSEQLQDDAARLLGQVEDGAAVPSLGITAEVVLPSEADRQQFAREYLELVQQLLARYQGRPAGPANRYTAMFVCYPAVGPESGAPSGTDH